MPKVTTVKEIFDNMCSGFKAEKATGEKAVFQFDFSGPAGGKFWTRVAEGACDSGAGEAPEKSDITLLASAEDWIAVVNGELNPMAAFMAGKIKVQGNMGLALKLQNWFTMA